MKKLMVVITLLCSAALMACASTGVDPETQMYQSWENANAPKALLTVDCPTGCNVTLNNPNQKPVSLPKEKRWHESLFGDFGVAVVGAVTSPQVALGYVAAKGIDAAGDIITNSNNTTSGDVAGDTVSTASGDTSGDVITETSTETSSVATTTSETLTADNGAHIGDRGDETNTDDNSTEDNSVTDTTP